MIQEGDGREMAPQKRAMKKSMPNGELIVP
jgi:hypothetical protein